MCVCVCVCASCYQTALKRKGELEQRIQALNDKKMSCSASKVTPPFPPPLEHCPHTTSVCVNGSSVGQRMIEKEREQQRLIAEMKEHVPGVHDKLFNLQSCPQHKLRVAVAAALGKWADHVVVNDYETAKVRAPSRETSQKAVRSLSLSVHVCVDGAFVCASVRLSFSRRSRKLGRWTSCRSTPRPRRQTLGRHTTQTHTHTHTWMCVGWCRQPA